MARFRAIAHEEVAGAGDDVRRIVDGAAGTKSTRGAGHQAISTPRLRKSSRLPS